MRILVVDDSKTVHFFIKSLFVGTSYEVLNAMDGAEAVELVNNDSAIDVVLLDWEMPVKDGVTTLAEIRDNGNAVPIIMVTSKNDASNIIKALEKGANEYIMKPFTKEVLFEKISMLLGKEVA